MSRKLKEKSIRRLLTGMAFVSLLSLACIMLFLFMEGLPLSADYPLWDFLTGHLWYPTSEPPEFGIFPLIMDSLAVTILASCIAVPLGIMTATYLVEVAASRTRCVVKPFVELLVALPSVVIGFFDMVIIVPFLQDWFGADTRLNLLNAALMLALISVPTICSVAEDALFTVPRTLRKASLTLGTTRWETLVHVVIPSALSNIGTAVMLDMSRAIGETMIVLMVAGGAAIIPLSIFDPVRPMPISIAAEMTEVPFHDDHYFTLLTMGVVLLLFTLLFNMLAFRIAEKHKQTKSSNLQEYAVTMITFHGDNTSRQHRKTMMFDLLCVAAGINILALVDVCIFPFWNGSPTISWEFLTELPRRMMTAGGVWPCIVGTFLLTFGIMLIAFPLGVTSAIYLYEYGGKGRYTRYLRLGISNLAGVPSVVFRLFGLAFFVTFLGMGVNLPAGMLTLAVLTLPVIINTTEEALRQVPNAWREASLALGATRSQTIARVILPATVSGMLTGAILGLARAAGGTTAIMLTAAVFYTPKMSDSIFSAVMSLLYHMYTLATTETKIEETCLLQYGTALILLVLILGMSLIAIIIRDRIQRKR